VKAMSAALASPFEISGAAHVSNGKTLLRIEGFVNSITYRTGKLSSLLAGFGGVTVVDGAESAAQWRDVRNVAPFHGIAGDVWRISLKPSDAPELAARIGGQTLLDWGGGLIWALQPAGTDLRARLGQFAGHATLIRAAEATRATLQVFQPEPAPLAALTAGLRAKFDPRGILNPGLMA
jgi:glycolate oxidase FAD binding subunit